MDEIFTIEPPSPESIIAGIAYLDIKNMGLRFTSITRSQCSSVSSTTDNLLPIPTLLSSISNRSHLLIAKFTTFSHSLDFVSSAPTLIAVPPRASIISTVLFAKTSSLSTTRTFTPASANKIDAALPLPIPLPTAPPPATIATLPFRPKSRESITTAPPFLIYSLA